MRVLIFLAVLPALLAQNPKTPIYPGGTVTDKDTGVQVNRYTSTLTAALTATGTTVQLASATGLLNFTYLGIDSEFMMICAVSGSTVTIGKSSCPNVDGRGLDGTAAATHASGAQVAAFLVAGQFNQLAAEIKSMQANSIPSTTSTLKGNGTGAAIAVAGTATNCVHVDGSSGPCATGGGGATIATTPNVLKGDNGGNGVAVTGTGTNCVHVDGTSAVCGTAGAVTQSSICSIDSFGAVGDGATNDAAAFTTAQGTCKQIVLTANKNYSIGTALTLTSAVSFIGGATMIANNVAVALNGTVTAPLVRAFTLTGSGTVAIGVNTPSVYPEWFGAITGSGDSTTAIQAAINSRTGGGTVEFQVGTYTTSSVLTVGNYFTNLVGKGPSFNTFINSTASTGNILNIAGAALVTRGITRAGARSPNCGSGVFAAGGAINIFGLMFRRATGVTVGDTINITNGCQVHLRDVQANDSGNGVHVISSAATTLENVSANNAVNGIFLDSAGAIGNYSTYINHGQATGSTTMTGLLIQGGCIADVFVNQFETAGIGDAVSIISTVGSSTSLNTCNSDLHFEQLILDRINGNGVRIQNVNGGGVPGIFISNSHFQSSGGSAGINISNSNGVSIVGNQFQLYGSQAGVLVSGGVGNIVIGNVFEICTVGVAVLSGSQETIISGNYFSATATNPTTTFVQIGVNGNSNTVTGNDFVGFATNAMTLDATAVNNVLVPNIIDPTNIANAIAGGGGKGNITFGPGYSTPVVTGCGALGANSVNVAGFITSATTGSCVSTLTFDLGRMGGNVGYSCSVSNTTSATNTVRQTASSSTAVTFTGTTTSGDVWRYACTGY